MEDYSEEILLEKHHGRNICLNVKDTLHYRKTPRLNFFVFMHGFQRQNGDLSLWHLLCAYECINTIGCNIPQVAIKRRQHKHTHTHTRTQRKGEGGDRRWSRRKRVK